MQRLDVCRLDAPKRTPQGGIVAPAYVTRTGVFNYVKPDGTVVREYRSPEEVFKADSLASLISAPVTRLHPSKPVTSATYSGTAVGHVGESVKRDGDKVAATLYVQDAKAVEAIESGMRQVSCGYTCDVDDAPGVTAGGEAYDRVQRNISYNHVALVPVGRAGADVSLRLDAADNQFTEDKAMTVERIDGVEYQVGSEQHKAAVASRDEIAKLKSESDKHAARADMAEGECKKLGAEVVALKDPARFDAAVAERASLDDKAKRLAGADFKCDGLDADKIRAAALAKAKPEMKLDGKSPEYVAAAFDIATEAAPQTRADAVARVAAGLTVEDRTDSMDSRSKMLERNRNAWKGAELAEGKE